MLGEHTLKGWSKTQTLIALSSGESKLYAALKASAEALGLVALLQDLGHSARGEVWGDASAALGIIDRRGLGKTRHIEIGFLWVQQTAADQRLKYYKVLGKENPADLYTKSFDAATSNLHVKKFGYTYTKGRSIEAPQLHFISQSWDECKNGEVQEWCEWVQILLARLGNNKAKDEYRIGRREMYSVVSDELTRQRRKNSSGLGQPVLQGYKRQVQGYNGSNSAHPRRPWGSTQTLPSRHNRVKHPCQDGHAVIQAWGVAHTPRVASREGRIRLPSEKGITPVARMNEQDTTGKEDHGAVASQEAQLHQRSAKGKGSITTTIIFTTTTIVVEIEGLKRNETSTSEEESHNNHDNNNGKATKSNAVVIDEIFNNTISPVKRQSEELYSVSKNITGVKDARSKASKAQEDIHGEARKLTEFLQGTEQLGVAATRIDVNSSVYWNQYNHWHEQ